MAAFSTLVDLFSTNYDLTFSQEDIDLFEQKYALSEVNLPTEESLSLFFKGLPAGDVLLIHVAFSGSDSISFAKDSDYSKFRSAMEVAIRSKDVAAKVVLKISVVKSITENISIIYALGDFVKYLELFTVLGLVNLFSEKIANYRHIIFKSEEVNHNSWSSTLAFVKSPWDGARKFTLDGEARMARLKTIKSVTHAVLLSDKALLPEDFQFLPPVSESMQPIFDKLNLAMIIMAVFDLTTLTDNSLSFRLNGYKGIDGATDLSTLKIEDCIGEYNDIYNWINQSGNLNDKLGLARNIISLHLNPTNDLLFTGSMHSSVLSAYKVYEKQNIKQYIEIRNKLSDQLIDYNKRANTIVEGFAGTFQKSALSVLTLFSSIIALKVLSSSAISENFVTYSAGFSVVILVISLIYMFISRSDAFEQRNRYVRSYQSFKERYTDLLNDEDIKKILNNDKEFDADVAFIKKKIKNYTVLWSMVLLLISAIIIYYFYQEKITEITLVMTNYPNLS